MARVRSLLVCLGVLLILAPATAHAKTVLDFPGGSYVDGTPQRAHVVLFPGSHLQTSRGRVALPGMDVLQVRICPDGVQFGGIGSANDQAYTWNGSAFSQRGLAYGPSSVICAPDNTFRVHSNPDLGPIGYRFFDAAGRLWTGAETYIDAARRIYEWTTHGDITIGQGGASRYGEDPVIALYQGKRYVLASGTCRFIRFHRAGNDLSIAYVRQDTNSAHLLWLTASELTTYPEWSAAAPPPPKVEVCDNGIDDDGDGTIDEGCPTEPEPQPEAPPDHRSTVREVSDAHPHLVATNTKATITELLWRAADALHARDPRWGLLTKTASQNHTVIAGQRVAVDAVIYKDVDRVVDIFKAAGDGPGTGGLSWGLASKRASNHWLAPPPFPGNTQPEEPEEEPEPDPDLEAKVAALAAKIGALEGRVAQLQRKNDEAARVLTELLARPVVTEQVIRAYIDAALATLKATVRIGRNWGHDHEATVEMAR